MPGQTSQRRAAHGSIEPPISISCRFILTDQWLSTHVDPAWTIFELKRHLLARCVGGVPLAPPTTTHTAPRLFVPSEQGKVILASLVRAPHALAIKASTRPSTAPQEEHSRRRPRLSLKVVQGLSKPTSSARVVTVHPPTPGFTYGAVGHSATGPQPMPQNQLSPRNPLSSPELSPPRFQEPDSSSLSSRSTVGVQGEIATSPTFSSSSPPSRPFSPTPVPGPSNDTQPLLGASEAPHLVYGDFGASLARTRSTPPLVRAMSTPPSPYSPKPPTPTTSRPPQPPTSPPGSSARSPPLSSSLQSRSDISKIKTEPPNADTLSASGTLQDYSTDSTSELISAFQFLNTEEPPVDPTASFESHTGPSLKYNTRDLKRAKRSREEIEVSQTPWEDEFRLVSFSLGCVLDEHVTLSELRIRPGELIEIQRANATVHLARPMYILPYFEAPVYVLRRSSSSRPHTSQSAHAYHHYPPPSRTHQHHIQHQRDYAHAPALAHSSIEPMFLSHSSIDPGPSSGRIRSGTVTARGKDTAANTSLAEDDLDGEGETVTELDMDGLDGVSIGSGGVQSNTYTITGVKEGMTLGMNKKIEWKFRWMVMREGQLTFYRARAGERVHSFPLSQLLSAQQLPASPALGSLPRHYISIHFNTSSSGRERDAELGLRMMHGAAHAHFLRVLLRTINTPSPQTLLFTDTPHPTPAPLASQYPEWRQHIVQRGWLAGRATSQAHPHTGAVVGPWRGILTERELELLEDSDESAGSITSNASLSVEMLDRFEDVGLGFGTGDDSDVEWNIEAWRVWESENAVGNGSTRLGAPDYGGRPRSRSLVALASRSSPPTTTPQPPPQQLQSQATELLSPTSTVSSEVSISSMSPSQRRGRSSTVAGVAGQPPDSPLSTSPSAWASSPVSATGAIGPGSIRRPVTAGNTAIEAVLGAPTERRGSQQRRAETDRRGSATSLEMQRAVPSARRAATGPGTGARPKAG